MHAAPDHAHAHILHGGCEQPGELAAERIVRCEAGMQSTAAKEIADLRRLEILARPGPRALELEAIVVDCRRAFEFLRQRRWCRIHAGGDGGLGSKIFVIQRTPGPAVFGQELCEAFDGGLDIEPDRKGPYRRDRPVPSSGLA